MVSLARPGAGAFLPAAAGARLRSAAVAQRGGNGIASAFAAMLELKFDDVNLALVEQRAQVRHSLRMAFNEAGLHNNIVDGTELSTLVDAVNDSGKPDIVICESDTRGGDVLGLIHAIRHNEVGRNPFLAVIAISWEPTARNFKLIAESGADYLIAAPFSPHQVFGASDRWSTTVRRSSSPAITSDPIAATGPAMPRRFR